MINNSMESFKSYIVEYNDEVVIKQIRHKASQTSLMISRYKNGSNEGKYVVRMSKSNYQRGKQNKTMRMIHDKPLGADEAVALFNKKKNAIWNKK